MGEFSSISPRVARALIHSTDGLLWSFADHTGLFSCLNSAEGAFVAGSTLESARGGFMTFFLYSITDELHINILQWR